jgi:flagellar L-ring protein precursor FlgH
MRGFKLMNWRPCSALGALTVLVLLLPWIGTATIAEAKTPLVDFKTGESLVTNIKARNVGDLITIIITEESNANAASRTKANNKSETRGGPALGWLDFMKPWDMTVDNKYLGDGDTRRTGSLHAEITARITQVMPNGDLFLEGTRMVNINGEKQLIEITGTCRSRDINSNNTLLSTFISDAQIAYNGSGMINDTSQPGVVTRVLNWLF